MGFLYHITAKLDWQAAQRAGEYRASSLEAEGFIHCSLANQVTATGERYYKGITDLVLLEIDDTRLSSGVRYEPAPTGEEFPHIYGPLNLDAVVRVIPFQA